MEPDRKLIIQNIENVSNENFRSSKRLCCAFCSCSYIKESLKQLAFM